MADPQKISELVSKVSLHDDDLLVIVDSEELIEDAKTKKIAAAVLKALVEAHASTHQNGGVDEIDLTGMEGSEIRLTPKTSSAGPEGTIFYHADDKAIYVGAGT